MPPRPREAPPDWVEVDCQNPACNRTAWIPPDMDGATTENGTPLVKVCSALCALAMVERAL